MPSTPISWIAAEYKTHTPRLARLNYESSGHFLRSSARAGRKVEQVRHRRRLHPRPSLDGLARLRDPAAWAGWMATRPPARAPAASPPIAYDAWATAMLPETSTEDPAAEEGQPDFVTVTALYRDLRPARGWPACAVASTPTRAGPTRGLGGHQDLWRRPLHGRVFPQRGRSAAHPRRRVAARERAHLHDAVHRTIVLSLVITGSCILLGYPDRLSAGATCRCARQRADDPRAAAVLDLAAGAHLGLEGAAAAGGRDQRHPGLDRLVATTTGSS
jgi:putative spermidine/putrescine transport system permease protein